MFESGGKTSGRERRALEMLHSGLRVAESPTPGQFYVASQSGNGIYKVTGVGNSGIPLSGRFARPLTEEQIETCTCPDFDERTAPCKHIFAVRHWLAAADLPVGTPSPFLQPAKRIRPNQPAYDLAQNEEYRLFGILLRDLCIGIPEPERDPHGAGRPPTPLREQAYCAIQKAYVGFSCRRSQGFRTEAAAKGQLSAAPYWDVPSKFLCRDDVAPILHDVLARSALPLIGVDNACAIDSSGFRTSSFHYYRHEKYEPSRMNIWLKAHIFVGIQTHVVPVMEITAGSANDSPHFPTLLQRAVAAGFEVKEVYADKGYQSRKNFDAAAELGVNPFIPFKVNSTGQAKGSPMYHKMFLFFQLHREEFDQHYGQRAQVETTFGAIKQKLGERLLSRNFTAQVNELIAKLVAYNITVLIRQMFERSLLPDFLKPPEKPMLIASPTAPTLETPCPSMGQVHAPHTSASPLISNGRS